MAHYSGCATIDECYIQVLLGKSKILISDSEVVRPLVFINLELGTKEDVFLKMFFIV